MPMSAPPMTAASDRAASGNALAQKAVGHIEALYGLVDGIAYQSDEVDRLRKEVEMWRSEWAKSDKQRRNLESEKASGRVGLLSDLP